MTNVSKAERLPVERNFDKSIAETARQIRDILKNAPKALRRMTMHLSDAPGKMIRGKALLVCAINEEGFIPEDALKAAVSVELIHLATLVHDDVIDLADRRRGIEALHKKFGQKYAVLCGDWLLCKELELVSMIDSCDSGREQISRILPPYITEVCLGEILQNQNVHNYRLSEKQYFQTIRGKTAALFEACFYAGYIFSGEPESMKERYLTIGNNIGLIFQLADDCADYEAAVGKTNKPVFSDCTSGVVTLPLIRALKNDKELKGRLDDGLTPMQLKEAVEAAGGLDYTHGKIEELYQTTLAQIEALNTTREKNGLLEQLLKKATGKASK